MDKLGFGFKLNLLDGGDGVGWDLFAIVAVDVGCFLGN